MVVEGVGYSQIFLLHIGLAPGSSVYLSIMQYSLPSYAYSCAVSARVKRKIVGAGKKSISETS